MNKTACAQRERILVVDDEPQIHRFLTPALEAAGYAAIRADDGANALRLAATRVPDAILLDLGLPDLDGQDVLVRLRRFSEAPVIVLSARDQEAEKIAALDAGADDYVEKPFGVGELLARIRNALRHVGHGAPPETGPLDIDNLHINPRDQRVQLDGSGIHLTRTEFRLLLALARSRGKLVKHDELLRAGWGAARTQDPAYIRMYIHNIRRKLGDFGETRIRTRPGLGYSLE